MTAARKAHLAAWFLLLLSSAALASARPVAVPKVRWCLRLDEVKSRMG